MHSGLNTSLSQWFRHSFYMVHSGSENSPCFSLAWQYSTFWLKILLLSETHWISKSLFGDESDINMPYGRPIVDQHASSDTDMPHQRPIVLIRNPWEADKFNQACPMVLPKGMPVLIKATKQQQKFPFYIFIYSLSTCRRLSASFTGLCTIPSKRTRTARTVQLYTD